MLRAKTVGLPLKLAGNCSTPKWFVYVNNNACVLYFSQFFHLKASHLFSQLLLFRWALVTSFIHILLVLRGFRIYSVALVVAHTGERPFVACGRHVHGLCVSRNSVFRKLQWELNKKIVFLQKSKWLLPQGCIMISPALGAIMMKPLAAHATIIPSVMKEGWSQ